MTHWLPRTRERIAPKVQNKSAQGNALGSKQSSVEALKGRNNVCSHCFALSGLANLCARLPRALPWADLFRTFGALAGSFRRVLPLLSLLLAMAFFGLVAVPAGAQPARDNNLVKKIAPLIDGQTFAVAHVRLDNLDVGRLLQLTGKIADVPARELAPIQQTATIVLAAMVNAGVREAFVVGSLDGFPFDLFCVAFPVAGLEEGNKLAAALKLALNLAGAREKTGEWMVHADKNLVTIASANTLKRQKTLQPMLPPHLEKALTAFPDADARLALVLPDTLRRSLSELMPQLPAELGGGKTAPLLDGFRFFSLGLSLRDKASIEAVLRTSDAGTALATRTLILGFMNKAAKEVAREADVKVQSQLGKILDLLTPKGDNNALTWRLTEDECVRALQPLAAQLQGRRGSAQSANNLKQIALAMHNYHDVHKQFPTGIRGKDGKLLLSWRVQILPFVEHLQLYQQFKLDEPWDSDHNIKLVKQMPPVFRSPISGADAGKTTYLIPTGKGLFFDPAVPERKIDQLTDGTSNTIMVLEADDDRAVTWSSPDDWSVDPKQPLKGLGGKGTIRAAFADGSIRTLSAKMDPAEFWKQLTVAGGEVIKTP